MIVLTRYVPIEQYGYYNAIVSFVAIISLFFPTLGVDNAIAREAAGTHARGGDVIPYYSALASLTMFLSIMYAVALIFLAPILRYHGGVPSYLVPIVYLLAAGGIIINVLVGPMGFYLWSTQRTATQGLGSTIGSLTYRLAQIALILAMRNVYAIAIASLLGNLATLIFFLVHVRVAPRVIEGFRLLRGRLRSFFNSGFQYWIASYLGSLSGNILSYLVFLFLGPPTPSALFGISVVMTGAVGGFSAAVGNVFGSSASHAWGGMGGLDVGGEMAKRYALSAVAAASLLSSLAVLLAPPS